MSFDREQFPLFEEPSRADATRTSPDHQKTSRQVVLLRTTPSPPIDIPGFEGPSESPNEEPFQTIEDQMMDELKKRVETMERELLALKRALERFAILKQGKIGVM